MINNSDIDRTIKKISASIKYSIELFDMLLHDTLSKQQPYLSDSELKLYKSGKKLRPLILLLCGHLSNPTTTSIPTKLIKAAVSLEMLHVATLIHDDIVDDASMRRGFESIHKSRGIQMAVLMGDMQFIQAIQCFADEIEREEDLDFIRHILNVGFNLCKGEIDEINVNHTLDYEILRLRYYHTADRKTARLFRLACQAGFILQNGRVEDIFCLGEFGSKFGLAFQIMDDISDLSQAPALSGKELGIDIAQRRLSMPIIEALNSLPKQSLLHYIYAGNPCSKDDIKAACQLVVGSNSFFNTYCIARRVMLRGIDYLNYLPNSIYKQLLIDLSYAIIN